VQTVVDSLLLASVRRFARASANLPPPTVRSLAYFSDVIEELLRAPLDATYRAYLVRTLVRTLDRSLAAFSSSA
jgi:hypothetical protein